MNAIAYCFRSGEIRIGRRCPEGALPLASGSNYRLRKAVSVRSRHAYDGTTYLVPGVPEADSDDEAFNAVVQFRLWLTKGFDKLVPACAASPKTRV